MREEIEQFIEEEHTLQDQLWEELEDSVTRKAGLPIEEFLPEQSQHWNSDDLAVFIHAAVISGCTEKGIDISNACTLGYREPEDYQLFLVEAGLLALEQEKGVYTAEERAGILIDF